MTGSILNDTKKVLGLAAEYDAFDADVIMHINSILNVLFQMGIGPTEGYQIEGADNTWTEFTEDNVLLNLVKSYVYLRVRLIFDPPSTSFHLTALAEQVKELEWRIVHMREVSIWTTSTTQP